MCDYVEKFNARQYMAAAHHEEMVAVWNRTHSHLYRGLMILAAPNLLALVPPFSIHLDLRRVHGDEVEWQEFPEPQSSQDES